MASHKYSNVEVKAGIFMAFCLGLFVLMLITYGRFAPMWRGRVEINVIFDNISGLRPDAPVRYNGLEVGRVKWMRLLHFDAENLDRLPPLTKRDLDNLPLRPDAIRKTLRLVSDEEFDERCRAELKNRTMIELCLEVLREGDMRRYRVDDRIRIVSTVFGDTAVEIISGSGGIKQERDTHLLLGASGDFFSNLAKSMGEVKGILSSVTDVVGAQERHSFVSAQARLSNINAKLDKITTVATRRAEFTGKQVDKLSDDIPQTLSDAGKLLEDIRPQARQTADNIKASLKETQEHVETARADSSKALDELAGDWQTVRQDVRQAFEKSDEQLKDMRANVRTLYDRVGGLSRRFEDGRDNLGRLAAQNEPEIKRMVEAFKNGLLYFKQFGLAAIENKDLMYTVKDKGENELNTAICAWRSLCLAAGRLKMAGTELQQTCATFSDKDAAQVLVRASAVKGRLAAIHGKLEGVRVAVEEFFVPGEEPKKAEVPPAK